MSTASAPIGFTLEAFLTRVLPGVILLSPFIVYLWRTDSGAFGNLNIVILVIALGGLVVGETLEFVRSASTDAPLPFQYYMYRSTGDLSRLPWKNQLYEVFRAGWKNRLWRVYRFAGWVKGNLPERIFTKRNPRKGRRLSDRLEFDLRLEMEVEFDLDPELALTRDYFDALILYLGDGIHPRTRQLRNWTILNSNVKTSNLLAAFVYGYFTLSSPNVQEAFIYFGAMVLTIAISYFVIRPLDVSPDVYVEMLAKEFYLKKSDGSSTIEASGSERIQPQYMRSK